MGFGIWIHWIWNLDEGKEGRGRNLCSPVQLSSRTLQLVPRVDRIHVATYFLPIYCHEKRNFTLNLYLFNERTGFPPHLFSVFLYSCTRSTRPTVYPQVLLCTVAFTAANNQSSIYSGESCIFQISQITVSSPLRASVYNPPPTGRASSSTSSSSSSSSVLAPSSELVFSFFSPRNSTFACNSLSPFRLPLLHELHDSSNLRPPTVHGTRGGTLKPHVNWPIIQPQRSWSPFTFSPILVVIYPTTLTSPLLPLPVVISDFGMIPNSHYHSHGRKGA